MSASERLDAAVAADRARWGVKHPLTWTIRDEGARPLTVNKVKDMHRQQWATHTRETRGRWHLLALEAKVPRLDSCTIVAQPLHANRRTPQDVAACAPEVKAAIDGLVDAGLLDDDGPAHLRRVSFLPPLVCGVDGLELTVEACP